VNIQKRIAVEEAQKEEPSAKKLKQDSADAKFTDAGNIAAASVDPS